MTEKEILAEEENRLDGLRTEWHAAKMRAGVAGVVGSAWNPHVVAAMRSIATAAQEAWERQAVVVAHAAFAAHASGEVDPPFGRELISVLNAGRAAQKDEVAHG